MDEATSALDPTSEREVQEAIDSISSHDNKLTIIIIAHRLETIMTAENLLYFESNQNLVPAQKGTPEYEQVIKRLKEEVYAH